MSEEAAKRYCEAYDKAMAGGVPGCLAEAMAAHHRAGLAAVVQWAQSSYGPALVNVGNEADQLRADLQRADREVVRLAAKVDDLRADKRDLKTRMGALLAAVDVEAALDALVLGVVSADSSEAWCNMVRTQLRPLVEREAMLSREVERLTREVADANVIAHLNRKQYAPEARPVLTEEQAREMAGEIYAQTASDSGVNAVPVIAGVLLRVSRGDFGAGGQPDAPAPKDEQASAPASASLLDVVARRLETAEDMIDGICKENVGIADRLTRLEAAKPARPRVGRWVDEELTAHLMIYDATGHDVAGVWKVGDAWGWLARRPFLDTVINNAPTLEAAQAAALAVLRTWADVEGDEQPAAAPVNAGNFAERQRACALQKLREVIIEADRALREADRPTISEALSLAWHGYERTLGQP